MALYRRLRWRLHLLRFALTAKPVMGGEGPPAPPADPPKDTPPPEDPPKGDPPEGDPEDNRIKPEDDWQAKARKHEREAKRLRKEREEMERKLREREDEDKSEHEKALEKARQEARTEALTEAEKDRRSDRLDAAVTRLAARGIDVGEGDDAQTMRFADPEDALVNIERAIRNGDVDEDDIFDADGKVQTDALTVALTDLLKRKPHLRADAERRRPGDPDTRKGGPAGTDLEAMTPEDHAKRKYGSK